MEAMRTVPADRKSSTAIDAVIRAQRVRILVLDFSLSLRSHKELLKVVAVSVGVVSDDLRHLGHESCTRSPFDVNQQVEGISDIALDGSIRKLDIALQNATGEATDCL
jgi:hypothetical protein